MSLPAAKPRYALVKQDPLVAVPLIRALKGFPQDYLKHVVYTILMRGATTFGAIPAPPTAIAQNVIGFKGKYFRYTTQNCGADVIWHDRASNQFLFWGPYMSVVRAMNVVNHRIALWTERSAQGASEPSGNADEQSGHNADEQSGHNADEQSGNADEADAPPVACYYCLSRPTGKMPKCGGCRQVRYCDVECQTAGWKKHKTECSIWSTDPRYDTRGEDRLP